MTDLNTTGQYEKAAKLCPKVLGGDAQGWEDWIFKFAHAEELSVSGHSCLGLRLWDGYRCWSLMFHSNHLG
jgi:hypothetical protein